jgi:prevent-host-death family protein
MRFSTQIKSISYVKAHAAALLDRITKEREPIIITQNGEARAVLLDIHSYEETQERIAMLQVVAGVETRSGEPLSRAQVFSEISGRKPVLPEREIPEQKNVNEYL